MPNYEGEEVVATKEEIGALAGKIALLNDNVMSDRIPSYSNRMKNLNCFKNMIGENLDLISQALMADLNQADPTPHLTDCLGEVDYMISNLQSLMKPKSLTSEVSLVNFPATAKLVPEPLGTVLIVGTWNFPFHAALGPVPGALAAGNRVVVKPGSLSRNSSRVISELVSKYFSAEDMVCVEGGIEVMTPILNEYSWGHIFFTGSTRIGKIVMQAAAQHLTPVTLELGGKSPCIVTASADISLAARRIAWGKWAINAGQVCIAPDHVLVDACVADEFVGELKKYMFKFFDKTYCRIISKSHVKRLNNILDRDKKFIAESPTTESEDPLVVVPHILDFDSDWSAFKSSACMQEEIFGPVLPIIRYKSMAEVDAYLASCRSQRSQSPLAFYIFTKNEYSLASSIAAGAVVVNDTGMHIAEVCLPFGGTGASGMGGYHGKKSFEVLTHYKPVLYKSGWLDIPFRYPPFTKMGNRVVGFLLWLGRKNVTPLRIGKVLYMLRPLLVVASESGAKKLANQLLISTAPIAVDCEGARLGRFGPMSLIQIGLEDGTVALIDALRPKTVESMRPVFESESLLKVFHDCREDSAALFHQFDGIKLNRVFDTQVASLLAQQRDSQPLRQVGYSELSHSEALDDKVKSEMKENALLWHSRPLTKELIEYAINGVKYLLPFYNTMKGNEDEICAISKSWAEYAYLNSEVDRERIKIGTPLLGTVAAITDRGIFFKLNLGKTGVACTPSAMKRILALAVQVGDTMELAVSGIAKNGTSIYVDHLDGDWEYFDFNRRPSKQKQKLGLNEYLHVPSIIENPDSIDPLLRRGLGNEMDSDSDDETDHEPILTHKPIRYKIL